MLTFDGIMLWGFHLQCLLASVARMTQREMEMFSDVYKLRCLGEKILTA